MRGNKDICLIGSKTILVPYRKLHVPRYHEWMKNEELQRLTASEPLTLTEEYEMQQSWLNDDFKCTFIVLDKKMYTCFQGDENASMVGDVNLFFNDDDDRHSAELELMIAEESARGKGMGKDAAILIMQYGIQELGVTKYTAKIGLDNDASINLFKKLGFDIITTSDVFREITLQLLVTDDVIDSLTKETGHLKIESHSDQS